MSVDGNLLFGILALQNDFITRDQLVDGMNAWVLVKHRPLGDLLLERGALEIPQYDLLAALKANARHPDYRQYFRNHLLTLVQTNAGLRDEVGAKRAAEKLRDLGWDPPGNAYDAGCALSLCIPSIAKDDQLDAAKRQAAMQWYGDEALQMLHHAIAKGYKNTAQLKQDAKLDPLRQRADFKKLLAELEATAQKEEQ